MKIEWFSGQHQVCTCLPPLTRPIKITVVLVTRNSGLIVKYGLTLKVLLADANQRESRPLESALRHAGFSVSVAENTDSATRKIAAKPPDLILLNTTLPGTGSMQLCKWIRIEQEIPDTWIIMLCDRNNITDRMLALDAGADDILNQPFDIEELLEKVTALQHRRRIAQLMHILKAGNIEMVPDQWSVYVDGTSIKLTETEYRLLYELLEVKGRVITREALLERVWGYDKAYNIESRTLDVHMSRLRHKLGTSAKNIITVRSVGYRISVLPD